MPVRTHLIGAEATAATMTVATCIFLLIGYFGQPASAMSCNLSVISPVSDNGNTADSNGDITWGVIPQVASYRSTGEYDDGGLGPYFSLARSFVNTSIPSDLPFHLIDDIMAGSFDIGADYQEIIDVSLGYIVCVAFGILFTLVFPLVGLIFCCCRCCGNCGGKRVQKHSGNMECKRTAFSLTLLLLIIFISVAMICLFVTNDRMTVAVNNIEEVYDDSLADANLFIDNLQKQVKHLSSDNFNFTYKVLQRDMNGIDTLLGVGLKNKLKSESNLTEAVDQINLLATSLQTLSTRLKAIDSGVKDIENNATALNNSLNTVKSDIQTTLTGCACGGNIDLNSLSTNFDTASFPSLSSQLDKINSTQPSDLSNTIDSALSELEDIPCRVKNDSKSQINDVLATIDDFSNDGINTVTKQVDDFKDSFDISSYKDSGDEYFGYAKEYNEYRSYGGIGLACLVLLMVVLLLFGLLLGVFCSNSKQKPTERSCLSNSGGNMLIAAVALIFIFSWLLMLLTTLTYALGGPMEKWICQPISDFDSDFYTKVLDKEDGPLGEGYFLGTLLFQNKSIDLTLSGVLRDCQASKAAYSALKLNNLFDIDTALDYKKYIDIDSNLASISSSVDTSVNILTPQMLSNLQDIKDAVDVDTTTFLSELNNNLAETDLGAFAQDLRDLGKELEDNATAAGTGVAGAQATRSKLDGHANTLDGIQSKEFADLQNSVNAVKADVTALDTSKAQVTTSVDGVNSTLQATQDYINNNGSYLLSQEIKQYVDRLTGTVTSFVDFTRNALQNDMGRCDIVYNLFASVVTVGICKYFVDAFNAFWLSLGWCLFFFVPSVIFAVKLAKYFRRMSFLDNSGGAVGGSASKVFPSPFPSRKLLESELRESTPDDPDWDLSKAKQNSADTSTTDINMSPKPSGEGIDPPSDTSSHYSDGEDNKVGHMDGY